jgi:hypothetical protein
MNGPLTVTFQYCVQLKSKRRYYLQKKHSKSEIKTIKDFATIAQIITYTYVRGHSNRDIFILAV